VKRKLSRLEEYIISTTPVRMTTLMDIILGVNKMVLPPSTHKKGKSAKSKSTKVGSVKKESEIEKLVEGKIDVGIQSSRICRPCGRKVDSLSKLRRMKC